MLISRCNSIIALLVGFILSLHIHSTNAYYIGVGIHDITGPCVELNMMGYANPSQIDTGIHTRLFSRAFVIKESAQSQPVVFVSLDAGMVSQILKTEVVKRLTQRFGPTYSQQNVLLSATHTHSGPAGYFEYLLYTITSLGFSRQSFDALVDGIYTSIVTADSSMQEGRIYLATGDVYNASINRSPASYLENPVKEREMYTDDVDRKMTLLKFVSKTNQSVAMLNWFAVHPVNMNYTNKLVSSDNKGLASVLFEGLFNKGKTVGKGPFVAAFAQTNEGDVSANTKGPRCIDTGEPCDFISSTCNGRVQKCIAFGPGSDMLESTKIIAQRQKEVAKQLFDSASEEVLGPVKFIHQYVDMTNVTVTYQNQTGRTCKPAMGYSFAAGTMDGPGAFDFIQGETKGTLFWNLVRDIIKKPSHELQKCQAPKPVLLATGEITFPYQWQPDIVETQILRIGQLLIVAVPGEFTTMSGRRIRASVEKAVSIVQGHSIPGSPSSSPFRSVIAGLSNVYSSYVTTYEEYQLQRYEGASTIYGPYTLQAYVEQYEKLASNLIQGKLLPPGPKPPFFVDKLISLVPPVLFDHAPISKTFGDVLQQPNKVYNYVDEVVTVKFVSANPRNNLRLNDTYLTVDQLVDGNTWQVKFTDANWETKFHWQRQSVVSFLLGQSEAIITWSVSSVVGVCTPGVYRIRHFGTAKRIFRRPQYKNFVGTSDRFEVKCIPRFAE